MSNSTHRDIIMPHSRMETSANTWDSSRAGVWAGKLGGLATDPKQGDEWTYCSACARPTTMTGTKLCDRCWSRRDNPRHLRRIAELETIVARQDAELDRLRTMEQGAGLREEKIERLEAELRRVQALNATLNRHFESQGFYRVIETALGHVEKAREVALGCGSPSAVLEHLEPALAVLRSAGGSRSPTEHSEIGTAFRALAVELRAASQRITDALERLDRP